MSFLLDPPLLVASGAAIERAVPDAEEARRLSALTLAAFVGVSAALYARAPGLRAVWGPFGARDGREFMLGSGLVRVDHEQMAPVQHALAVSQFALYPAWLALGRRLGRR